MQWGVGVGGKMCVCVCVCVWGGACEAGPSLSPSQALLGCTQSQPNKKPFIGRVQLSQTGWEHVAFKNEEGGIRGREAQNERQGGGGGGRVRERERIG